MTSSPVTVEFFIADRRTDKHNELEFDIHGSVHRDSILIRSNELQQYAGVYLL